MTVEHAGEYLGELLESRRLYATERRNPQDDIVAQFLFEQLENIGRLMAVQVYQNGGNDLRVLVADELGDHGRFHQVQGIDT